MIHYSENHNPPDSTRKSRKEPEEPKKEIPPDHDVLKKRLRARQASALERESFNYRALTKELYIEGFIKGLEAAGLDRTQLNRETVTAINNLLQISQTLAGQRLQVTTHDYNRSEIRKMARHVDETALMVDEYIQAITEACGMVGQH